jgi:hypothetical protein
MFVNHLHFAFMRGEGLRMGFGWWCWFLLIILAVEFGLSQIVWVSNGELKFDGKWFILQAIDRVELHSSFEIVDTLVEVLASKIRSGFVYKLSTTCKRISASQSFKQTSDDCKMLVKKQTDLFSSIYKTNQHILRPPKLIKNSWLQVLALSQSD